MSPIRLTVPGAAETTTAPGLPVISTPSGFTPSAESLRTASTRGSGQRKSTFATGSVVPAAASLSVDRLAPDTGILSLIPTLMESFFFNPLSPVISSIVQPCRLARLKRVSFFLTVWVIVPVSDLTGLRSRARPSVEGAFLSGPRETKALSLLTVPVRFIAVLGNASTRLFSVVYSPPYSSPSSPAE